MDPEEKSIRLRLLTDEELLLEFQVEWFNCDPVVKQELVTRKTITVGGLSRATKIESVRF